MKIFLLVAALMAGIAAAAVATPLLRQARNRLLGAGAGLCVIAAAAGLYPLWSNWDWHAVAPARASAGPEIDAMIAKLEQHLKDAPQDQQGWLMLGRSYTVLERTADAQQAYEHAYALGRTADAALGLGEALSMRMGGEITPQAAQLFEEAVSLAPDNPKALLYGGFAAAARGDRSLARQRWESLKELHPPQEIEAMLDARIAELGSPGDAAGTSASPAGTSASAQPSATAQTAVNISIAPELKSKLATDAPLFVFARQPGQPGPPLAAKRLTAAAIGTQVRLSSADAMVAGRGLTAGQRVSITARVSFSGQPTPMAGDLYGEVIYEVGRDAVRDLVINRVQE